MPGKDDRHGEKGPGPAYPARYVRLRSFDLQRPGRLAILLLGILAILALILLVTVPR